VKAAPAAWPFANSNRPVHVSGMGKYLLLIPLFAILAGALWYAVDFWMSVGTTSISATGYLMMGLGIAFSLLVGCGLMALVFYSSRHGYDDKVGLPDDQD
jgi:hypothetical protein